ncbi:MAG: glycosyltransferase involved in cell wall biosynthesis [Flavobacteriaceae bacterium]
MTKKTILFIKRGFTRFEDNDFNLLAKNFNVKLYEPGFNNIYKVFSEIRKVDILYYWFPNDYKFIISLIAKILNKKIIIVGGGQMSTADTKKNRKFARVKYRFLHRILGILSLKIADKIITVSKYEFKGISRYVSKNKISLIFNSIETKLFNNKNKIKRDPKLIITISGLKDTHYHRKGLDVFVNLSKEMPDYKFVLIGKDCNDGTYEIIKNQVKNNFSITGAVSDDELVDWMFKASIYCQFSRQEGFGVALAESMACGCIPVVSQFGAIPEVAGPDAYYIEKELNYKEIKSTIIDASKSNIKRDLFSQRIISLFNDSTRNKLLIDKVNSVFK